MGMLDSPTQETLVAKTWYVRDGQKVFGPFDSTRLKQFADARKITVSTEVSQSPDGPWARAEKVRGLFETSVTPSTQTQTPQPLPENASPPPLPDAGAHAVSNADSDSSRGLTGIVAKAREGAAAIANKTSELVASPNASEGLQSVAAASKELFSGLFAKKPKEDGLLESYSVVYKGGHPDYPKEKAAAIEFKVFGDRFEFTPKIGSKSWFHGLMIPYDSIHHFEIVQRQVGTVETILGGINSRQLNQPNNIHIEYDGWSGSLTLIRFEMLTGVTVMGQAKTCSVLLDRLRNAQILDRITRKEKPSVQAVVIQPDIPDQIEKLAALREKGVLSQEEFEKKKAELLAKM
jgi:hypothetical protein